MNPPCKDTCGLKNLELFPTFVDLVLLNTFQNLRVSSPAPVTMASPSGDMARYSTRYEWPVNLAIWTSDGYFHTKIWFCEYPCVLTYNRGTAHLIFKFITELKCILVIMSYDLKCFFYDYIQGCHKIFATKFHDFSMTFPWPYHKIPWPLYRNTYWLEFEKLPRSGADSWELRIKCLSNSMTSPWLFTRISKFHDFSMTIRNYSQNSMTFPEIPWLFHDRGNPDNLLKANRPHPWEYSHKYPDYRHTLDFKVIQMETDGHYHVLYLPALLKLHGRKWFDSMLGQAIFPFPNMLAFSEVHLVIRVQTIKMPPPPQSENVDRYNIYESTSCIIV